MIWRICSRGFVAVGVAFAAMGLSSCSLLDANMDASFIAVEHYYFDTDVSLALARSDIDRKDPALIARDFSRQGWYQNPAPCALSASELIGVGPSGSPETKCQLFPGWGGVTCGDPKLNDRDCVMVSVNSETWADPVSRQVILSALTDSLCEHYGRQHGFCTRKELQHVPLHIEVKPRLAHPCVKREYSRGKNHSMRLVCTNPDAKLITVDAGTVDAARVRGP